MSTKSSFQLTNAGRPALAGSACAFPEKEEPQWRAAALEEEHHDLHIRDGHGVVGSAILWRIC